MVVSSRTVVATCLGLVAVGILVGPSTAQQQDTNIRKTTGRSAAPTPASPPPATFGSVDMTAVFKGYDKVKVSGEEFKAAVMAKKNELMKVMSELQQTSEMMAKLTPGSPDFKKYEDRITQLKAQSEAGREQAEREFALREAEMLATLYKEIQAMVTRVAKHKQLNYVIRISNDPVTGSDPNSAMRAIERTVVYADTTNDITADVVYNLNLVYKANGGGMPKPSSSATPTGTRPNGN